MNIQPTTSVEAAQALSKETQLEKFYGPIGLALDINGLMPEGIKYQKYTTKYATFAANNPTPDMLVLADDHARAFINFAGYTEEAAKGATIWVLSRIWAIKRDKGVVYTPGLLAQLKEIKTAREQTTELHKAISRLAKNAPEDSFAAGLQAKVTEVLRQTAALQLADLTGKAERGAL